MFNDYELDDFIKSKDNFGSDYVSIRNRESGDDKYFQVEVEFYYKKYIAYQFEILIEFFLRRNMGVTNVTLYNSKISHAVSIRLTFTGLNYNLKAKSIRKEAPNA